MNVPDEVTSYVICATIITCTSVYISRDSWFSSKTYFSVCTFLIRR